MNHTSNLMLRPCTAVHISIHIPKNYISLSLRPYAHGCVRYNRTHGFVKHVSDFWKTFLNTYVKICLISWIYKKKCFSQLFSFTHTNFQTLLLLVNGSFENIRSQSKNRSVSNVSLFICTLGSIICTQNIFFSTRKHR